MRHIPLLALALSLSASPGRADDKPKKPGPQEPAQTADACTRVRGSVRLEAYGYTHVITLQNTCAKPVECQLWSDVDPDARVTVSVAPGEATEIITRRGSPAREVTGHKKCRFR